MIIGAIRRQAHYHRLRGEPLASFILTPTIIKLEAGELLRLKHLVYYPVAFVAFMEDDVTSHLDVAVSNRVTGSHVNYVNIASLEDQ